MVDNTVQRGMELVDSKWRASVQKIKKWNIESKEGIVEWAEEEEETINFVVKKVIREAEKGNHSKTIKTLDNMLENLRSGETYYKEHLSGYKKYRGHEDVDLEVEVVVESIYEALLEDYLREIEKRDRELIKIENDFIKKQNSYWNAATEMAIKNAKTKPFIAASKTSEDLRDEIDKYDRIENALEFILYLEDHEDERYNLQIPENEISATREALNICEERKQELKDIIDILNEATEIGSIARQMVRGSGNPGVLKRLDEAFMTGSSLKRINDKYNREVRVQEEFIENILENLESRGINVQDVREAIEEEGVQSVSVLNLLASKKLGIAEGEFEDLQSNIEQEEKEFIQNVV